MTASGKPQTKYIVFLAGIFLATFLFLSTTAHASTCENPDSLTFALVPTEETVAELQLYKPITDRLAQMTGKKISFFMPTSYASVVEGLLSKYVDVAVLGPYSYVIAHSKDPSVEVFATYAKLKGHMQEEGPGYKAALITKKGTRFTTIDSLKGATVGLVDPGSTSGNLLPRVVFSKDAGVEFDRFFGKVAYTGSHEMSTVSVYEGKIDGAFVATHRFDNVVNKGDITLDDVNILWQSNTIPQDPFVYRAQLCEDIKENIRKAFLDLHNEPSAKSFLDNVKSNRFVPMTANDYDIIRDVQKAKDGR